MAVIAGGGTVATRKARSLLDAGARVRVIAPEMSPALERLAADNDRLSLIRRKYAGPADIADAELVISATDVAAVNAEVAGDARSLHRLANDASASAEGNCSSMAVHRAGQLALGVSAGNVPAAAARIRDAIAERFDDRYAMALSHCAGVRAQTLAENGREEWTRVSDVMIGADFCKRVEEGFFGEAVR